MEGSKVVLSHSSSSSTTRKTYMYGEWISTEVCECGQELSLRTSWTNDNPGRRYWECSGCKDGSSYTFVKWYDPPMCPRSKRIIPGLLKKINKCEEEKAKLKSKPRSVPRGEDGDLKDMRRSKRCSSMKLLVVCGLIVLLIAYFTSGNGKNERLGFKNEVYLLP
ncbi:PREDICTED: uncharacterized protein LOC109179290 [Ipomoea nil]|uniref:uncharacterized protein LOC109179290 n=1 Tax=Ipomoea nil TaxID=35883 RepID=UPI0009017667|nr:PREDICTED: uncharacterized protein LOC109179290 [Ipomoea nil]